MYISGFEEPALLNGWELYSSEYRSLKNAQIGGEGYLPSTVSWRVLFEEKHQVSVPFGTNWSWDNQELTPLTHPAINFDMKEKLVGLAPGNTLHACMQMRTIKILHLPVNFL